MFGMLSSLTDLARVSRTEQRCAGIRESEKSISTYLVLELGEWEPFGARLIDVKRYAVAVC